MEKLIGIFGLFIFSLAVILGLALLMAYPTMWVVNYLFTPQLLLYVFGVTKIGLWKALVLDMFFGFAFKSNNYSSKSK